MKKRTKENILVALAFLVWFAAVIVLMNWPADAQACDNNIRFNYHHNSEPGDNNEPYIFDGVGLVLTQNLGEQLYISGGLYKQVNPYFDDENAWRATVDFGFVFGSW